MSITHLLYKAGLALTVSSGIICTSCKDDLMEEGGQRGSQQSIQVTVSMERQGATRAKMIDNPGVSMTFQWEDTDQLGLAGNANPFTLSQGTISADGHTATFTGTATLPDGTATLYYPYQVGATGNASTGALTLSFPHQQVRHISHRAPQPDASVNMLAGRGDKYNGVTLRPLMAMLKVGLREAETKQVQTLTFRDLSGTPVSGSFNISWESDMPTANFTGTDAASQAIVLDCQETDSALQQARIFYLTVPARTYDKGFELLFTFHDGSTTTKTVGKTLGKTLERGLIYPIGDTETYSEDYKIEYELQSNARMMTDEWLELIAEAHTWHGNNNALELTVHKNFKPHVGDVLVFNQLSEMIPEGMIGEIVEMGYEDGDMIHVSVRATDDLTKAFKELNMGPDGITIDLAKYMTELYTPEGELIRFTNEGGTIKFGGVQLPADTRASKRFDKQVTIGPFAINPTIKLAGKEDDTNVWATFELSGEVTMDAHLDINISWGKIKNVDAWTNCKGTIALKTGFQGQLGYSKDIVFAYSPLPPIIIWGIVIKPTLEFSAHFDAALQATLSGSISYTRDFMVGVKYTPDEGITMRKELYENNMDKRWDVGGLNFEASPRVAAGLGTKLSASIFGLVKVGVQSNCNMVASATKEFNDMITDPYRTLYSPYKFTLGPELTFQGEVVLVGHNWKTPQASYGLPPIWEWYNKPQVDENNLKIEPKKDSDGKYIKGAYTYSMTIGRNLLWPQDVAIAVYEGGWAQVTDTERNLGYGFTPALKPLHVFTVAADYEYDNNGEPIEKSGEFQFNPQEGKLYGMCPVYGSAEDGWDIVDYGAPDIYGVHFTTLDMLDHRTAEEKK
ncbi:MAG: hypothetical protein IJT98_00690 [Prevotella sp.]|nr:hypothetical protein [Prevotella sp.]